MASVKGFTYDGDDYYFCEDELATKAEVDGSYSDLHAGTADQLLSDNFTTDEEPYHFRQTPSHAGTREMDEIVGGSVVWNQLVNTSTSSVTVTSGHKYVAKISDAWSVGASTGTALSVTGGTDMVFDITQMFPSTIADHIYSLEQATAGAGVAFFRKYFPDDYYAYDAGTMRSVEGLSSHDAVGFNQWDEEWANGYFNATSGVFTESAINDNIASKNYIPCLPNTVYCIHQPSSSNPQIYQYDSDKSFVGRITGIASNNGTFTTASNCKYIKFCVFSYGAGKYNHDICINISDTAKNGTYEPYEKHTYPLDNSVTLRGIPQLVDGKLKFDGDTYSADGVVTRRYGTRAYQSGDEELTNAITDGTNTVYKLTTPTTEQAEPYQSLQTCSPYGTEEYVSASIVPIGHYTKYPTDLKGVVEQIADVPSADGTYTLKAVVSGGKVTYSWETN